MTAKTMREMFEAYAERDALAVGSSEGRNYTSPNCSGHARAGFLAAVSLLMPAVEALEWYSQDCIDHCNYHSLMGTKLTPKAREALRDLMEKLK